MLRSTGTVAVNRHGCGQGALHYWRIADPVRSLQGTSEEWVWQRQREVGAMVIDPLIAVIAAGAFVLLWMLIRSRRTGRTSTPTRRHWEEYMRVQEEAGGPPEPEWHLKELDAGGKFHLSLPKGLEEDYVVSRRDRLVRTDEQVEYALQLQSGDPDHPMWLNWWKVGIHTHAWLVEPVYYTLDELGLTTDSLAEMQRSGEASVTYRDRTYTLVQSGILTAFAGGRRPGRDFSRWDFRDESGTRQVLVYLREWEDDRYQILAGHELWLRDMTIISPRGESPDSGPSPGSATEPRSETEEDRT